MRAFEESNWICSFCYSSLKKFHDFHEDVKKKHGLEDSLKYSVKYEEYEKETVEIVELPAFEENFVDVKNFEVEKKEDDDEDSSMKTESESEEAEDEEQEYENGESFERLPVTVKLELARQRAQEERAKIIPRKRNALTVRQKEEMYEAQDKDYVPASVKAALAKKNAIPKQMPTQHEIEIKASRENRKKISDAADQKVSEFVDVKCSLCNLPFEKFSQVTKHFKTAHPDKKGFLLCCGKKFEERYLLLYHIESHIHPEMFKCTICTNKRFKTTLMLKNHMRQLHTGSQVPSTCDVCKRTFVNELALKYHTKIHFVDPDRVFECYKCENKKFYENIILLKRHFSSRHRFQNSDRDEESVESYVCEVCSKLFSGKGRFSGHMQRHKEEEIIKRGDGLKCPECDSVFGRQKTLTSHLKRVHNPGGDKFICEICSKECKTEGNLKGHISAVHVEVTNRLPCHICGNLLKNKKQLQNHINTHSEALLNITCKECGHKAKNKRSLWGHMRYSHKLQRNLPCHFCPKLLKTDIDLKEHEATHTGGSLKSINIFR